MKKVKALGRLLNPRTVAVFGGDSASRVVKQCRAIGFQGDLYAVNPNRTELAGVACVASTADLPVVPDASFIAAPPEVTLEILRELAAMNAPGAVCFAAGFAETGAAGAELQQALQDASGNMAVMGPNCHGYLNYLDNVALWPDEHGGKHCDRGVAVISQSGNIAINLTMQQRGIDFSHVVSIGNCGVLGVHDYIEALLDDDRVRVIGMLIEGIDDVAAFSRAAISALQRGVPLVVFKNGRSRRGAEISLSHTGALAGSAQLNAALFERLGIASCDTLSQFLETMKFLSIVGVLRDRTIGSLSCSGGDASIVADNATSLGLEMPALSEQSAHCLRELLGPNVAVGNPLDYHLYIWGNLEKLSACFSAVLENGFGCALLVLDYPGGENTDDSCWQTAEQALLSAIDETGQQAVIVASLPETMPANARYRLKRCGIAPMQGIEDCLTAICAAAAIGRAQAHAADVMAVMGPGALLRKLNTLDEWQGKQALATVGLAVPKGASCDAGDAPSVAATIGYPVVLKALGTEILHKSEAGAVALNLRNEAELLAAIDRMRPLSERFLVEEIIEPVIAELIVGISRDSAFGLTLLVGSGGTLVELLNDTMVLLLPASRDDIDSAVGSLKVNALLNGYRGRPAADRNAVLDAIESIVAYALQEADTLQELDVNPLLATPRSAVAGDVLIRKAADEG